MNTETDYQTAGADIVKTRTVGTFAASELSVSPKINENSIANNETGANPIVKLHELKGLVGEMLTDERNTETITDPVNFDPEKNISFIDFLEREVGTDISEIISEGTQPKSNQEIKYMTRHINVRQDPYCRPMLSEDENAPLQREYDGVWNGIKDRYLNGLYTNKEMRTQIKALYNAYWFGRDVYVNNPVFDKSSGSNAKVI